MSNFQFDVAFSYAGEQRSYVHATYELLARRGVRVFYDGGQVADLWGRDLYQYLSDIYSRQARYCVLFLSQEYGAKLWTRHELKAVQARAFQESREYLLPARFDDTEIPGLLPTIGYVDLRSMSPGELADLIATKVQADAPIADPGRATVDPSLEADLADAVLWAEEYLQPQPLDLSDAVAEAVRSSLKAARVQVDRTQVAPYLRSPSAAHRVVGYLAFQIHPDTAMTHDLLAALRLERREASDRKETRPLWQLLLCMGHVLRGASVRPEAAVLIAALKDFLSFLEHDPSIDSGGECKNRIRQLLSVAERPK